MFGDSKESRFLKKLKLLIDTEFTKMKISYKIINKLLYLYTPKNRGCIPRQK